jgi:hypothetical protein
MEEKLSYPSTQLSVIIQTLTPIISSFYSNFPLSEKK